MPLITLEYQEHVAVATLGNGKTNAINPGLITEFAAVLERVRHEPDTRALVLVSASEKFFSIGFDLTEVISLPKPEFQAFIEGFKRVCTELYTLPKPTVAAICGHAIGGGCIIVVGCDYRFAAEGRTLMGINAIKIGAPIPYPCFCMLRDLVGSRNARAVMDSGKFYEPEEARGIGLVDQILPRDEVVSGAVEHAKVLGSLAQDAFALNKRNRTGPVMQSIRSQLEEQQRLFVECWYSDVAQQKLRETLEKF